MYQFQRRFVWALPFVAILALNASLTFANVWPTPAITWRAALAVELAVAVLGLALLIGRSGPLATPGLRWITGGWVVLVFGHYTDVTARGLFGRDINLYWDSRHFANVAAMLTGSTPLWVTAGYALAVLTLIGGVYVVTHWSFRQIAVTLTQPLHRQLWAASAATILVLYGGLHVADSSTAERVFAEPVTPGFLAQGRVLIDLADPNAAERLLGTSPPLDVPLDSVSGADVVLVFLESYGAIAWDDDALATELSADAMTLESAATSTNRRVVSAFVESPTFGASSWLAHISLLAGVEVQNEQANQLILSQERDTLVSTFRRAGYRTVAVMPGLRQAWPEGAFFRFDEIYGFDALDYSGPEFGWWTIPDQFSLARLDQFERRAASRAPVFAFFATGTSHAPFGPVPPYQPDWSQITSPTPFPKQQVDLALTFTPDLADLRPSYREALAYDLKTLAGYLVANAGDDLVLIVIGDHQPPAAVGGSDLPWDVPVHVITSRASVVEGLLGAGFGDGVRPARPVLSKLHELLPILLHAFGPRLSSLPSLAE